MKNKLIEEIDQNGLINVAALLKITPDLLKVKTNSPKLFKTSELFIMQNKMGFSDTDIKTLLNI